MGGLCEFVARSKGVVVCCGDGCVVPVYGVDEGVAAGIIHEVVDVALVVGVATRVIWEAAAIAIVDATKGTVIAETDAAGVIHDAAVIAAGIIADGSVEYSVMSAVVGIVAVSGVGIEGELANDVVAAVVGVESGVTSAVIAVRERKKVGCHWCRSDLVLAAASLLGLCCTSLSLKSLLVLVGVAVNFDFREARQHDGG